jgi:hypothetical protein
MLIITFIAFQPYSLSATPQINMQKKQAHAVFQELFSTPIFQNFNALMTSYVCDKTITNLQILDAKQELANATYKMSLKKLEITGADCENNKCLDEGTNITEGVLVRIDGYMLGYMAALNNNKCAIID